MASAIAPAVPREEAGDRYQPVLVQKGPQERPLPF